jgi:ribosomal protein S18 acetylase RimI-like enzyme
MGVGQYLDMRNPSDASRADAGLFSVDHAEMHDLDSLVLLLDAYRQFYGKATRPGECRSFLFNRLMNEDSLIFVAAPGDAKTVANRGPRHPLFGFIQLYPAFSSLALDQIWLLNDLYVIPEARRHGVGRALVETARDFLTARGDHSLVLETAPDNSSAKALYESLGFSRDSAFTHYSLRLQP